MSIEPIDWDDYFDGEDLMGDEKKPKEREDDPGHGKSFDGDQGETETWEHPNE